MNSKNLVHRLKTEISAEELQTRTQASLAKQFDVSQPSISAALRKLFPLPKGKVGRGRSPKTTHEILQVIEYVKQHGGYVAPAIKALGLRVCKERVYTYCKEHDIDLSLFRFAHRKYGHWLTLPGKVEKSGKANYRIPAVCTLCGTKHIVNLTNLASGKSSKCISCTRGCNRQTLKVKCHQTGKTFNSVMAWVREVASLKQYTKLRLQIQESRSVDIDGLTYSVVEPDATQPQVRHS